jgi:hypothetical protein
LLCYLGGIVGDGIARHPLIRKLGFTGSTEIGKVIMQSCTTNLKKVSLELGKQTNIKHIKQHIKHYIIKSKQTCFMIESNLLNYYDDFFFFFSACLGGKSPLIIFDDCDHGKAVRNVSKSTQKNINNMM